MRCLPGLARAESHQHFPGWRRGWCHRTQELGPPGEGWWEQGSRKEGHSHRGGAERERRNTSFLPAGLHRCLPLTELTQESESKGAWEM